MKPSRPRKTPKRRRIVFAFHDHQAREVAVTGDFNQWNRASHPMKQDGNGRWKKVVLLLPGQYEYKFIVNGHWRTDPDNPKRCRNCFGTYNNILQVVDHPS
jgi:5'-AMP-activated protein kinase regulatory beta subunit